MARTSSSNDVVLSASDFNNETVGGPVIHVEIFKKMKKVFKVARLAVCKVKPAHEDQGTGAFYEREDLNNKLRFLFMTCNHVLPTNSLEEVSQAILEFEEIEKMKYIKFDRKQIKYVWTSKLFDATIIEMNEDLANLYKSYGAKFLKVGKVTPKTGFALLQYPEGQFGISHGEIDHINGYDVFYQSGTAPGSSGSPLLDWNCVALAMHKGGKTGSTADNPVVWRKASALMAIIDAYMNEQANDFFECEVNIFHLLNQISYFNF